VHDGRESLAEYLRRDGNLEDACARLEDTLAQRVSPSPERVAALTLLADCERQLGAWARAAQHLDDAGTVLDGLPPDDLRTNVVRFNWTGTSFQLRLDWGYLDEAGAWLARQTEAAKALVGAGDEPAFAVLLSRANLEIAAVRHERAVELLDSELKDPQRFAAPPGLRARLQVRLALALEGLERDDPARERRARSVLEKALAVGELEAGDRQLAEDALIESHLAAGELADAEALVARIASHLDDKREGERDKTLRASIAAWRTRVALARGDDRNALARCRTELLAAYDAALAAWSDQPRGSSGHGFLHYAGRRRAIDALVALPSRTAGNAVRKRP
jgi:hypothetical protein